MLVEVLFDLSDKGCLEGPSKIGPSLLQQAHPDDSDESLTQTSEEQRWQVVGTKLWIALVPVSGRLR